MNNESWGLREGNREELCMKITCYRIYCDWVYNSCNREKPCEKIIVLWSLKFANQLRQDSATQGKILRQPLQRPATQGILMSLLPRISNTQQHSGQRVLVLCSTRSTPPTCYGPATLLSRLCNTFVLQYNIHWCPGTKYELQPERNYRQGEEWDTNATLKAQ